MEVLCCHSNRSHGNEHRLLLAREAKLLILYASLLESIFLGCVCVEGGLWLDIQGFISGAEEMLLNYWGLSSVLIREVGGIWGFLGGTRCKQSA